MRWVILVVLAASLVVWPGLRSVAGVKPSLNSYFASDFKDMAYQKSCLDRVLKVWAVPAGSPKAGKKTVVQSSIARDGSLIGAEITMKSGSDAWDAAALAAVRKAAPFKALPGSYRGSHVEVHWHFNAN